MLGRRVIGCLDNYKHKEADEDLNDKKRKLTLTTWPRMDVESVISCLEYYGGVAPSIVGQHVRLPGGSWGVASREPLGVVGGDYHR